MPALGADMESGTVVEWLVGPGDVVRRGDVVAVVDTDKAAIDVECFESGVVERLLVEPGSKVAVGAPLAVIGVGSPASAAGPAPAPEVAAPVPAQTPSEPAHTPSPVPAPRCSQPHIVRSPLVRRDAVRAGLDPTRLPGSGPGGVVTRDDVRRARSARPRISPYARRLATERGFAPTDLRGTGPAGVILARDVPASGAVLAPPVPTTAPRSAESPASGHPVTPAPASAGRRATAALMARASREIPHYYLSADIDLAATLERLRTRNLELPVAARLLPAAALLRATVLALGVVPELNGHWIDDGFVPGEGVHLGVAVSLRGGGLAVPVIRDADRLDLESLMARMRDAGARARAGRLRSSEVSGATATVTNLGEQGVDSVAGVIHPPQVALIGFGTIRPRPWVVRSEVLARPIVTATLAADHRATDGAVGARLLHAVDRYLQRPEELD